jgi:general secretion pathway protein I
MRRARGFTLIEVVVAFVLLSLVLAVSFEIFTNGFSRAAELEEYSQALQVAQSRLAAAGVEETLKEGETQGDSEDRRFHWITRVTRSDEGVDPSKPPPSIFSLYRVEASVTWRGSSGKDRALSLVTLQMWTRS